MIPKQAGNTVEFDGTFVPAANIQVENVPGFIEDRNGHADWYGIYFEVLFEDGALWVVDQGCDLEEDLETIHIEQYDNWGQNQDLGAPSVKRSLDSWEMFLTVYKARANP